eukprot:CAMPEP_0195512408 /NCGR_PEP_ID=MMETSP0794_2-20130614/4372_1 /TAXON_ID=515487 /ORGANISM="Stephanopyxis turris, Strain CCMP 815" /LENGTH=119 /DNA_ID=CAMNT_0040640181 /DNA_START=55 /DNA_END=414 /DNA_ORIENTATION=+
MFKQIFALFAMVASATAFVPATTGFGVVRTVAPTALKMAVESPQVKKSVIAAAAGIPAMLAPMAAFATEGTNEWFGVDDLRLLGVLFVVHWAILSLWLGQYKSIDEDEDFFGEIDYTGR